MTAPFPPAPPIRISYMDRKRGWRIISAKKVGDRRIRIGIVGKRPRLLTLSEEFARNLIEALTPLVGSSR